MIQSIVLLVINIVFILLGGYAFSVLESREDKNVSIIYKLNINTEQLMRSYTIWHIVSSIF